MKKIILLCLTALSLATVNMALATNAIKCPTASIQYKKSMTQYDNWMVLGSEKARAGKYVIAAANADNYGDGDSMGSCIYIPDGSSLNQDTPRVMLDQNHLKPYGDHWRSTRYGSVKDCIENNTVDRCEFQPVG